VTRVVVRAVPEAGAAAGGRLAQAHLRQRLGLGAQRSRSSAQGLQADLVVFDEQRVRPAMPTVETDLPVRVSGRRGAAPVRDVTPRV